MLTLYNLIRNFLSGFKNGNIASACRHGQASPETDPQTKLGHCTFLGALPIEAIA
jgi:hypothetical protein